MATQPAHIDAASLTLDMTNPLAAVEALSGLLVADVRAGGRQRPSRPRTTGRRLDRLWR